MHQSETCGLEIPEIDLHLQAGTLGGRFTTLEGILTQVYEELSEKVFLGDSSEATAAGRAANAIQEKRTFSKFLGDLKSVSPPFHFAYSSVTLTRRLFIPSSGPD